MLGGDSEMNTQQIFAERLSALLEEKNISQGEFAEMMKCSRQSINFYILGKRSPDIVLAAEMAERLGVSCDYLLGRSDIRQDQMATLSVGQIGITDETMKFFTGLQLLAANQEYDENLELDYAKEIWLSNKERARKTLQLLNQLISHERFGVLLQYIKRYRDICHGEDVMALLKGFMIELQSPVTGEISGGNEENMEMMKEFCLHVVLKYFDEIVRDISKR